MRNRPPRRSGGRPAPRQPRGEDQNSAVATAVVTGPVAIPPALTVKELAERLGVSPAGVIRELLQNGVIASINQTIDFDTAAIVGADLGFEIQEMDLDVLSPPEEEDEGDVNLVSRPPVVTVMGHVDHGKTSLLDAIRRTNVVSGEQGGITQHIGAYQVETHGQRITFLDTPGHEAFTKMRSRGASVTDVAILVVAADEGVMAQTREAADHIKSAGVPLVVAMNKMDRPGVNVDRVKQELSEIGLLVEEYGGDIVCVPVSARTGEGIDTLLDMVLVVSEMSNPRANPNRSASGVVIEAKLDKARGPVATVLVQNGTLNLGDVVVAGGAYGRIKALFSDKGKRMRSADPAMPVEILGLDTVPGAGDHFTVNSDERTARLLAQAAKRNIELKAMGSMRVPTELPPLEGPMSDLNLVVKADVRGSLEAVLASVQAIADQVRISSEVKMKVVRSDTGNVTESDIMLAAAAQGRIIAFNVRVEPGARKAADNQGVDIRSFGVIYHLTEDLERLMLGMLAPEVREVINGHAEVRQIFKIGKNEAAGCYVTDGTITRNSDVRIFRRNQLVHTGRIDALRRFKDDVREVQNSYECGISVVGFHDFEVGDIIEAYSKELVSAVGS